MKINDVVAFRWLVLWLGCFTFLSNSSAQSELYRPQEAYLLGISHPQDIKFAFSTDLHFDDFLFSPTPELFKRWHLQGGYSPIDHLSVIGSFSVGKSSTYYSDYTPTTDRHLEWGAGYYQKIGSWDEGKQFILFNIYSGSGWGKVQTTFESGGESKLQYARFFIHPGVFINFKGVNLGVGIRYVYLNFYRLDLLGKIDPSYRYRVENFRTQNTYNFLEPGFQIQGGFKSVKFTFTMSPGFPFIPDNLYNDALQANLGMVLDLDGLFLNPKIKKRKKR